jgi:hypothetical protein
VVFTYVVGVIRGVLATFKTIFTSKAIIFFDTIYVIAINLSTLSAASGPPVASQ